MKALVFAAGLGTRLKPLTDNMPKALVPIGGEPLLKGVLNKLISSGYNNIVINIHHFAEQIEEYLRVNNNFNANISLSDERDLLRDTGGGIKHAEPLLCALGSEPFLVHNVDIISNLDLRWFMDQFGSNEERCASEGKELIANILVSDRETSRYFLFDDNDNLVGWTNVATGEVKSPFTGLDVSKCHKLAFAGIHLISPKIFPLMKDWPQKFSIVDFYLSICDKVVIKGVQMAGLQIKDVGKIGDLKDIL